jgi:hypothetical protein
LIRVEYSEVESGSWNTDARINSNETQMVSQNMSLRLSQSLITTDIERGMSRVEWAPMFGTVLSYCNRTAIFLVGMALALIFFMPNGMLSDSGTPLAVCASMVGMLACLLLAIGGCVGLVTGEWSSLRLGLTVQASLFGLLFLPALLGLCLNLCIDLVQRIALGFRHLFRLDLGDEEPGY